MDLMWSATIAANVFLLCLLLRRIQYLDFPFLTFLVAFNVVTAPLIWYVYVYLPHYYSKLYYGKPWALVLLWFAVTIEAHYMRKREVAIPIEFYTFIKIFTLVSAHFEFVQTAYWINQGMRLFNIAVILWWLYIFYPREEACYE